MWLAALEALDPARRASDCRFDELEALCLSLGV